MDREYALQPFPSARTYYGPFRALTLFFPEQGPLKEMLDRNQIECACHLTTDSKFISRGAHVAAVMYPKEAPDGEPIHEGHIYCSIACQRTHAAELRVRYQQGGRAGLMRTR